MKYDFLKAAFASVFIFCSTANASVIDVDFSVLYETGKFNEVQVQKSTYLNVIDDVLTLEQNSWYYVNLFDAIGIHSLDSEGTILSFDFMTTGSAEISGFQASNSIIPLYNNAFNLIGTQSWAIESISYTSMGEWGHFDIDLGSYFIVDVTNIMFINVCDDCLCLDVTASFKNMTISNPSITDIPEPTTVALFALAAFGLASRRVKR